MSQQHFAKYDPPPRYCETHKKWVDDYIKCPTNCCNGWKLRKSLELALQWNSD